MTQTKVGWSLGLLCVLAASACSSKSVGDDKNKGGTGAIISGGSGGSGGSASSGGSAGSNATAGTGAGGGSSGSASIGGTGAGGGCAGTPISCVDAETARACNPTTDMLETAVCSEIYAEDGLISNGCTTDEDGGSGCSLDDFADMECFEGVGPFAVCEEVPDEQLLNIYVACFHDTEGAHTIVPCYTDFVDDTVMPPTVDCAAARMACLTEMP